MDRGGTQYGVVVMEHTRKRVLQIARPRLQRQIGVAEASGVRSLLKDRQDTLPDGTLQEVIQVLHCGRTAASVAVLDGIASGGDMIGVVEQAEQPVDAIDRVVEVLVERADQ